MGHLGVVWSHGVPVPSHRPRYLGVSLNFLDGISLSPLYKGVGHCDSILMRSHGRPRSSVFFFPPPLQLEK